jgi:hypothetical protein
MDRRQFFKTAAASTAAGAALPAIRAANAEPAAQTPPKSSASAVLGGYSAADHRRRLENIAFCHQKIQSQARKHLVTSYVPGQCTYNLGEYPCIKPWNPDEWDERELDRLREQGIRLIQVHEEWNDSQRMFGGHKFSPLNPDGFRRFVDMVHRRRMKLMVYVSSGYFERRDPDFRNEWARPHDLREIYFRYAACSPASPSWRAYLLSHLVRILDEYGVDGFYNDLGYRRLDESKLPPTADEILAFEETSTHDGALADLLALIYAEVKRRGGLVKVHIGGANCPRTDMKVYDYLWVGEGARQADRLREAVKNYPPYVVPCLDMSRATIDSEDELYLHAIPYLQFPLLLAGRPFTGQRAVIPGIEYPAEKHCFWTRHCRAIWKHYQEHPDGPHSYGWWDSVPGRPNAGPTHARWLKQYLPMVEDGTWAWLEIAKSQLFAEPPPSGVVVSAFANRRLYLALANYNRQPCEIVTAETYVPQANPAAPPSKHWKVPPRSLQLLCRA